MTTKALLAALLICVSPLAFAPASAASKRDASNKHRVHKQERHKVPRHASRARPMAPVGTAYRNLPWADPSFDRNGRPYRPNFYSPCTVDLGYGRFASCDSWDD